MSDNWASEAAKKLKQRDTSQVQRDSAMLERRKLIEEQGPALWLRVRDHVKNLCKELNTEYGEQVAVFRVGQTPRIRRPVSACG